MPSGKLKPNHILASTLDGFGGILGLRPIYLLQVAKRHAHDVMQFAVTLRNSHLLSFGGLASLTGRARAVWSVMGQKP